MELVAINSEDNFKSALFVIDQSGHKEMTDMYWTSGTDLGNENNFFWASNGECLEYEPFHDGQPDNTNNNENCVELRNWGNIYKLNDKICDFKQYFICSSVDVDVHCQYNLFK